MKKNLTTLTANEVEQLSKGRETISVHADTELVYEKQVPIAGVVLVQGEIEFFKRHKNQATMTSSCIIGLNEVLNQIPVQMGCKVKKNSQIILLGKSEILRASDEHSDIFPFIKKFLIG